MDISMKILTADSGKIYASNINDDFTFGKTVYLPDTADTSQWLQFDSEDDAREYFGAYNNLTNAEMLIALGVQPNEEEVAM